MSSYLEEYLQFVYLLVRLQKQSCKTWTSWIRVQLYYLATGASSAMLPLIQLNSGTIRTGIREQRLLGTKGSLKSTQQPALLMSKEKEKPPQSHRYTFYRCVSEYLQCPTSLYVILLLLLLPCEFRQPTTLYDHDEFDDVVNLVLVSYPTPHLESILLNWSNGGWWCWFPVL